MVALPEDVKKEYTWNASVLNALMEEFKRLSSSNNKLTGFRRNLWELLLVTSEEWRPVYGHSLPGSVGRLKALINKFRPDNYGVLVSGKYGNSNTLKIEEEAGRYLVALKRSRVPVYTDMQIFEGKWAAGYGCGNPYSWYRVYQRFQRSALCSGRCTV